MLSTQITNKELRDGIVYYAGYCAIYDAVRWLPTIGYSCGIYGWNADVYACGRFALATGHRPAGAWRLTEAECERLNAAAKHARGNERFEADADLYGLQPEYFAVMAELYAIHMDRRREG